MKRFGYVSNPGSLACKSNRHFRLASWSEERLLATVAGNLHCLEAIIRFNVHHDLRCYRLSSDVVPFASHPINRVDWRRHFARQFHRLGKQFRRHGIRLSMHPGQFTVLNARDAGVWERSVAELRYHGDLLEALDMPATARIQIHVGGLYGDRQRALDDFCRGFERLEPSLRARLAIENDDSRFGLADCLLLHARTGVPVIFDTLHHACLNRAESLAEALGLAAATWSQADGPPLVDYSSQQPGRRAGTHADTLDPDHFRSFVIELGTNDADIIFELRDKEQSALKARILYDALGTT